MSKQYHGLLAGLRRWNRRRLEKRRWMRELLEALAEDDAAIMEALSQILEQIRGEVATREAAVGRVAARLDTLAAGQETGGRLAQALEARLASIEQRLEAQVARSAERFPTVPTSRASLLEPELSMLAHLAPALSHREALDVGAHYGAYSGGLLDLGFQVHALEPNPAARNELLRRLGGRAGLVVHPCAAGAEDGEGSLGLVTDVSGEFSEATQFASLAGLPLPRGLASAGSVTVPVRRLDSLAREHGMNPSVVKVDAEGWDLAVLRGMGELRPAIVIAEFWDQDLPFSHPGAQNRLPELVAHARAHGLPHHLVVFRRWGDERAAFFSGWTASPERSWGNVVFFADRALYEMARQHLASLLPAAAFVQATADRDGTGAGEGRAGRQEPAPARG